MELDVDIHPGGQKRMQTHLYAFIEITMGTPHIYAFIEGNLPLGATPQRNLTVQTRKQ